MEQIIKNVMDGYYLDHKHGEALLRLDLDEIAVCEKDTVDRDRRILYLEQEVEDLRDENALLRTRLIG